MLITLSCFLQSSTCHVTIKRMLNPVSHIRRLEQTLIWAWRVTTERLHLAGLWSWWDLLPFRRSHCHCWTKGQIPQALLVCVALSTKIATITSFILSSSSANLRNIWSRGAAERFFSSCLRLLSVNACTVTPAICHLRLWIETFCCSTKLSASCELSNVLSSISLSLSPWFWVTPFSPSSSLPSL